MCCHYQKHLYVLGSMRKGVLKHLGDSSEGQGVDSSVVTFDGVGGRALPLSGLSIGGKSPSSTRAKMTPLGRPAGSPSSSYSHSSHRRSPTSVSIRQLALEQLEREEAEERSRARRAARRCRSHPSLQSESQSPTHLRQLRAEKRHPCSPGNSPGSLAPIRRSLQGRNPSPDPLGVGARERNEGRERGKRDALLLRKIASAPDSQQLLLHSASSSRSSSRIQGRRPFSPFSFSTLDREGQSRGDERLYFRSTHDGVYGNNNGNGNGNGNGRSLLWRTTTTATSQPTSTRGASASDAVAEDVDVHSDDDFGVSIKGRVEVNQDESVDLGLGWDEGVGMACGEISWKRGELLGEGAYGRVYAGLNTDTGEIMAVKQITVDLNDDEHTEHMKSLQREISFYKTLQHPHVVAYYGAYLDREQQLLFVFLEYVSGGSIASMLKRFGPFTEALTKRYTKQILRGLLFLHENRVVHRDIKGANILINGAGIAKLADFGASKKFVAGNSAKGGSRSNGSKSIIGSVYWMAPEVMKGTGHGRRADIWSLGCTVVEMLTGKHPWKEYDNTWTAMFQIAKSDQGPVLPDGISLEAKEFLELCFAYDPSKRCTAKELLKTRFIRQ